MTKIRLLILCILLLQLELFAQTVEIAPFGGYMVPSRMNGSGGYVRFQDNAQYGGMVSIGTSPTMDIDLIYTRTDTKAELNYFNYPYQEVPLSINYIHGGFTNNFRISQTFSPFVGLNAGACVMSPKEQYDDVWFFSIGVNGGVKIYIGKRFGFRFQGQLFMPIQGSGFSFVIGSGGSGGGVSLYGTMVQFGVSGGLILRLGRVTN
ncbi:MAG: hypothetical protein IH596_10200 [Bacteroidales bacterium]|nr:hypothetical protein [Bacteroidales bacterium]